MSRLVTVVKVGGSILGAGVDPSILEDIRQVGSTDRLILVHGGGDEVTETAEKLGKKQSFIVSPSGIQSRFTDKETATIYTMVMSGRIGKEIVASLQKIGVSAIGLSGADGAVLRAERKKKLMVVDERGRKKMIDGGYTGKINRVDGGLLKLLLERGYLPVISPVALSEEYEFLNVDGDRAAAHVAGGVKAERVLFLTDVQGLLIDGKLVEKLTLRKAKELLPKIGFGMDKKVLACIEALEMGVRESIIASGIVKNPITAASRHQGCTVITVE